MITRATLSTIEQGLPKYRSMLAGNTAFSPGSFESIATVSVGGGGAANVQFTSIPATYTHLQVRAFCKSNSTASNTTFANITQFNLDTGNNYARHYLEGNGVTTAVTTGSTTTSFYAGFANSDGYTVSNFTANVIDILDYANTNKYKTVRTLSGNDGNGVGFVFFSSGLWQNTNAITSIKLAPSGGSYPQYSHFALYGIKEA